MKQLILVRHAKSSWKDPRLADRDRPLNKRGMRDAPEMGRRLAARNLIPDAIISSPAVRALTTAEAISAEIGFAAGRIQTDDDLYAAAPRDILDVVSMIGTECRSALIVSHNPALTDLANLFSADYIENVPTCGFLFVSSPAWSEFADGTLEEFDYPKNR